MCLYACTVATFLLALHSTPMWAYNVPKAFRFQSDESGFRVSVKGVEVLVHTTAEPMILAGNVQMTFKERHGDWHIDEQVREKRTLPNFAITQRELATHIRLWAPEGPEVEVVLESHDFNPLVMQWVNVPSGYDWMWVRLVALEDEHVYGAGEQYARLDLRGYDYQIWTHENGVARNKSLKAHPPGGVGGAHHTSYFPLPTFVSSQHYYCHVGGSNYVHLDFRNPKYHEISIHGPPEALYFNVDASFETLIRAMTYFLWRQPRLPDWVHTGAILGVQGGTKKMLNYYEEAKDAGVRVSALWIQDWSGNIDTRFGKRVYWDWVWDRKHYPGLLDEIVRLKTEGVRVLTYVTPNLHSKGTLFGVADKKGYLLKGNDGRTYLQDLMGFDCGTVDLTNPEAFDWYKGVLTQNLLDLGFGGWMADLSEHTPLDVVFNNGVDAHHMANAFPVLWARLNREVITDAEKLGEIMFFMRAGGTAAPLKGVEIVLSKSPVRGKNAVAIIMHPVNASGSSKYTTMMWSGDRTADWSLTGGLPSVIPAALSLGLSGVGLTHFDMALHTKGSENPPPLTASPNPASPKSASTNTTGSAELLLRSAELAVFTAIMRTHQAVDVDSEPVSPNGSQPTPSWQDSSTRETLERFGTLTRQYCHLAAYRMAVERQQYREGLPLQRPLFLHYQDDAESFTAGYQYLLGRDLLVAPVVVPGVSSWEVFLPSDTWEHLWSGQVYDGPAKVNVQAPTGEPPVFFRVASVWSDTFRGVKDIGKERDLGSERGHGEL